MSGYPHAAYAAYYGQYAYQTAPVAPAATAPQQSAAGTTDPNAYQHAYQYPSGYYPYPHAYGGATAAAAYPHHQAYLAQVAASQAHGAAPPSAATAPYSYLSAAATALPPSAAGNDGGAEDDSHAEEAGPSGSSAQSKVPRSSNGHFNMNEILASNIRNAEYFVKTVLLMNDFDTVFDALLDKVENVEPFCVGMQRAPSTAFCLLYRLCMLNITHAQLNKMIKREGSPYVRAVGFLYLRFILPSELLWEYIEPFLDDTEEFCPGSDTSVVITMGQFIENLLRDKMYYATILPRIKESARRDIDKKMLERELKGAGVKTTVGKATKFSEGQKVKAQYTEDRQWYLATIKKVLGPNRYMVVYDEYGNEETLDSTLIKMLPSSARADSPDPNAQSASTASKARGSRSRSRSRSRDRRRSSRSRSPQRDSDLTPEELDRLLRERARESAVAHGRDYVKRPVSYKSALSMPAVVGTARKRSKSPPPAPRVSTNVRREPSPVKKKEVSQEHAAKIQKLMAVYGSESSSKSKSQSDFADK